MKSRYFLLVILFSIFCLPEKTEAQNTPELLIGAWSFNYDTSISMMEAEMKVRFDKMQQPQRSSIENAYKDRKIAFYPDGNYLLTNSDDRESTGSWALINDGNTLKFTTSKGTVFIQNIKRLTNAQLILSPQLNGQEKAFIAEWHYTKN
jgi:hypothetical protein